MLETVLPVVVIELSNTVTDTAVQSFKGMLGGGIHSSLMSRSWRHSVVELNTGAEATCMKLRAAFSFACVVNATALCLVRSEDVVRVGYEMEATSDIGVGLVQ